MNELDEHEKAIAGDTELTVNEGWFVGVIVGCLAIVWVLFGYWLLSGGCHEK